ncbi:MAG: PilC/PilY family type IV pilus protein [Pseudomonadota bacterium]
MAIHRNDSQMRGVRLATALCALTVCFGQTALADDTDIFFGQNDANNPSSHPNVLMILDSSGSMGSRVWSDPQRRTRQQILQDVATDFISNMEDVNIGIMKYDIRAGSRDSYSDGGMVVHEVAPVAQSRSSLIREVDLTAAAGTTPLQETFLESAYYWMCARALYGLDSYESYRASNGRNYIRRRPSVPASFVPGTDFYNSPMVGACQRNYSVYITDGFPVRDRNGTPVIRALLNDPRYQQHTARNCTNPDGFRDGGECLDELAEFLFRNDFNSELPGRQNVVSHFIGFGIDAPFMQRAADAGGGAYYPADNAETLRNALGAIFNNVADDVNGFTAPAVTVNEFDRTRHREELYFTVFQPRDSYRWQGNLKRYRFRANEDNDGLTIIGQDGQPAVNPSTGFFYNGRDRVGNPDPSIPVAWSYWSDAPDGDTVRAGGAAGEFSLYRNVLTDAEGNALVRLDRNTPAAREELEGRPVPYTPGGTPPWPREADDNVVDRWLDWAGGIDAYDSDGDGSFTDARQEMGDPLHSKPVVVTYGGGSGVDAVIYMGTNEGYLHALDGESGEELFSFMPRRLWENIPYMAENPKLGLSNRRYGMDGPIAVWRDDGGDGRVDAGDRVVIYAGMRRGGRSMYALDVTQPRSPRLLWQFTESDHNEMGESWSAPQLAKINTGTTEAPRMRDVLIFGAGYHPEQDSRTSPGGDSYGNAIYIIDALTKEKIWVISNDDANTRISEMVNAIPSSIRALDLDFDGAVDRMYAVDILGRLFRLDVHNEDRFRITGGVIAELGGTAEGGRQNLRRFYYAPDVALGNDNGRSFLTVTLSSGFRAAPLETQINDYLYGVRDYKPFEVLGDDGGDYDYDIRPGDLFELDAAQSLPVPSGAAGFKFPLTLTGEKSLARSRVFNNTAFYTTYKPGSAPDNNPCAPAVGTGQLYKIDLTTGRVVQDVLPKAGIPPEVTFLFGAPPDTGEELDSCFGPSCPNATFDPDDPNQQSCDGDDCQFEEPQNAGIQVQCQAGVHACDTGTLNLPTRTYWRQVDPDN